MARDGFIKPLRKCFQISKSGLRKKKHKNSAAQHRVQPTPNTRRIYQTLVIFNGLAAVQRSGGLFGAADACRSARAQENEPRLAHG